MRNNIKNGYRKGYKIGTKRKSLLGVNTVNALLLKYTARIHIGSGFIIQIQNKTFTPEQIENMREYFGWEVENLCESQSEI